MRLIDADKLTKNLTYDIANDPIHGNFKITMVSVRAAICNAPAVDAVPVVVKLYNHSSNTFHIKRGDKISQLVILPVLYLSPVQVDKIEGGERGDNGFGSTGR